MERFLAIEAGSGIALIAAAVLALGWANSDWRESYLAFWHTPIGVKIGQFTFEKDLHFAINEVLMTVFFFVAGLEIRREIHRGELSELKRASLPLVAALGGMLLPAAVYLAFNWGRPTVQGWGIPMATDIAFAVGVLALLGKRVPPAIRILLLALAVIDDVGAIIVIALFYSTGIAPSGLVVAVAGVAAILGMQRVGVRKSWSYVLPAGVVWAGAYLAGVHPSLAGVAVGLLTPVRAWLGPSGFFTRLRASVKVLGERADTGEHEILPQLEELQLAGREAISPVERIQHSLHRWVAFGVMPLFALANAGVPLGSATLAGDAVWVFLGVALGLVLGKPLGILGFSWLAVKLGVAARPMGVTWSRVGLIGMVGGIGFTMALFVAQLAFPSGAWLETAKLAILTGSGISAVVAFIVGRVLLRPLSSSGAASSAASAESSTSL